jgi:hypothetical protein
MSFSIPFCKRARIRFADRVETVDPTYRIVDFGLEYQDGTIDSVAVGGNFHHLSEWTGNSDDDAAITAQADAMVDTLERGVAVVRAAAAADAATTDPVAS